MIRVLKALTLAACLSLGGCGALLITGVPLSSAAVSRSPDGTIARWEGTIQGRPLGDSPFELKKIGTGTVCRGLSTSAGEGAASCTDGSRLVFKIPKHLYGRLSGSYVERLPDGALFASGWGADADLDKLQRMITAR